MTDPMISEVSKVTDSKPGWIVPQPHKTSRPPRQLRLVDEAKPRSLPALSVARKLEEQRSLTAVERFAELHVAGDVPAQAKYYRDLLPQTQPKPGEQYAFEVDLDRCSGCKACVSACHSLNGLDEFELWRNVGLIQSKREAPAQVQTVTSACHHCVEPACMNGCPVNAYEKDGITGIVKHLDDQCFGCQYCTLMCPYDAPKFNPARGIVRKCDMCSQRLEVGEAPACVQACPTEAIRITNVAKSDMVALARDGQFIAGAPSPVPTQPTTRYKSARGLPQDLAAFDDGLIRLEHAHWPLVVMLTLTQLGVGTLLCAKLMESALGSGTTEDLWLPSVAMAWTGAGLIASIFHLGRPALAWRAVLNVRTSWLSREALAFGVFAQLMLAYLGALLPTEVITFPGQPLLQRSSSVLGWGTALVGLAGVVCSVMVYVATRRQHWSWSRTGVKFLGSMAVLGAASATAVRLAFASESARSEAGTRLGLTLLIVFGISKLTWEAIRLRAASRNDGSCDFRMAKAMRRYLGRTVRARFSLGVVGTMVLPLVLISIELPVAVFPAMAVAMLLCTIGGEFLERSTFFRAAPGSRMPGGAL